MMINSSSREKMPRLHAPYYLRRYYLILLLFRITVLSCCCLCTTFAKLFEPKIKKVARLTAELNALEAERLAKIVVVFGYEFDKLGFYTSVSVSTVLFVALVVQLWSSRRRWKQLALSSQQQQSSSSSPGRRKTSKNNSSDNSSAIIGTSTVTAPYTILLMLSAALFFYYLTFNLGKAYSNKNNIPAGNRKGGKGGLDAQRLSSLVILFGKYELDQTTFYALVCTSMVLLMALGAQIGIWCRQKRDSKLLIQKKSKDKDDTVVRRSNGIVTKRVTINEQQSSSTLDVIIIGCGPKSIGWFHLMQFLDMPNINVRAVVEPYYLDKTKCPYPPQAFVDLVMMLDEMGIRCLFHVGQLEVFHRRTLCVIAGRTVDNPRLFRECIGLGASHVYLESPGAPTLEQLKDMGSLADTRGVEVYMGYQRLCSSYIEKAMSLSRSIPKSHVFFCHNETYPSDDLPYVVSKYPEGMLRAMASQELAVLMTQFGVKADNIKAFKVNTNRLFSERQVYYNQINGNKCTDFTRVAFKITTKTGRSVSVMADRCGGLVSFAVVKSNTGKELERFQSHDKNQVSMVQDELSEDKEITHQCIIESEEYLELKKRVVLNILNGGSRSPTLTSIHDGIDVMSLADYCTKEINSVLKAED